MTGREVRDEAREARFAGDAGVVDPEGGLSARGGRAHRVGGRPPGSAAVRLKLSVEVFAASDGALYLLRLGAGDEFVLRAPRPEDRALIEILGGGYRTPAELAQELGARALPFAEVGESLAALDAAGLLEPEPRGAPLPPGLAERYDRQLIYLADLAGPGIAAAELQARLRRARVLLLGCGALGCWAASALCGAGVGSLVLVDDDRVELSNLNRQLLFGEAQLGRLKVDAAAEALHRHNSALEVRRHPLRVRGVADLALLLDGVDLVIATADWPPHELPRWVNRACLATGTAFLTAGQFPPKIRIGPLVVPGRTPCLECAEAAARLRHPLYDELADHRARGSTPDAAMAPTAGVAGALLASEALHHLLGLDAASAAGAAIVDLRTLQIERAPVAREPGCPACA
jgi:molybdopterin/thiamine biosynthesis adenylyltransferase